MHEYSIVQSLLDRVEEVAQTRGATSVHKLQVRIGELSGVEVPLLESAFDLFRKGSLCQDAELEVQSVTACWACPRCGKAVPRGQFLRCPDCGLPARLQAGDEIILDRIEMEVPDV